MSPAPSAALLEFLPGLQELRRRLERPAGRAAGRGPSGGSLRTCHPLGSPARMDGPGGTVAVAPASHSWEVVPLSDADRAAAAEDWHASGLPDCQVCVYTRCITVYVLVCVHQL